MCVLERSRHCCALDAARHLTVVWTLRQVAADQKALSRDLQRLYDDSTSVAFELQATFLSKALER